MAAGFRVVHVLLRDRFGRLLLQQIAAEHDRHALQWGSSVAGYVQAGESYESAARRKVAEELGIAELPLRHLGTTSMRDGAATKFIGVFLGAIDEGSLHPNPSDFAAVDLVPLSDLQRELACGSRQFTPTFEQVFRFAWKTLAGAPQ
ncbi:NUDIX domain-containing protein [Vulgatibacter sp.]|uniref:NUDIX domain-containing protein n=1 Tax=Vulgatibacter sp. TaxID=1971226 RepID=UPI003567199C